MTASFDISADRKIVVVGAGTMGIGIAQIAAVAGHPVCVIDLSAPAIERGPGVLGASLDGLIKRGTIDAVGKAAILDRVSWSTDLADAAGGALAIEAIVERLDAKASLFARLAQAMGDQAILASNTSSLSITALGESVPNPARFLGLHFFNPVPVMKLVEVIAGPHTPAALMDAAIALMRRWGKRPVAVRDVPGFIVNRVARPYYAEGFAALSEGVDAAAIDRALTGAGGFRMGPLTLADMIGHDVNFAVAQSVYDAYAGVTRFRPQAAQKALFDTGKLGRKSGSGVYDYAEPLPAPVLESDGEKPAGVVTGAQEGPLASLVEAARAAGIVVTVDDALGEDRLRIGETLVALGDGRTLAARDDADALIDWARDFATARTLVFSARNDQAARAIAGFAQAIDQEALRIADRPGQIVLRTLAQLANAAADAVTDDVASGEGIDEAMMYGANHPEGPLGWAARAGAARVGAALSHIADATGDELYRPAARFAATRSIVDAKEEIHG